MKWFRNWFKTKTFYYEDLPPEERIYLTIKDHVFPHLEPQGFTLKRTPLLITRTKGGFIHSIAFQKNKYNRTGEMASFAPYTLISFAGYAKWYMDTYGTKPEENEEIIGASSMRHGPGRNSLFDGQFVDLAESDNQELTQALVEDLQLLEIPDMDQYVEPVAVLALLKTEPGNYDAIFDLSIMTGDLKSARTALECFEAETQGYEHLKNRMALRKAYLEKLPEVE